jgi:hypothetical protein
VSCGEDARNRYQSPSVTPTYERTAGSLAQRAERGAAGPVQFVVVVVLVARLPRAERPGRPGGGRGCSCSIRRRVPAAATPTGCSPRRHAVRPRWWRQEWCSTSALAPRCGGVRLCRARRRADRGAGVARPGPRRDCPPPAPPPRSRRRSGRRGGGTARAGTSGAGADRPGAAVGPAASGAAVPGRATQPPARAELSGRRRTVGHLALQERLVRRKRVGRLGRGRSSLGLARPPSRSRALRWAPRRCRDGPAGRPGQPHVNSAGSSFPARGVCRRPRRCPGQALRVACGQPGHRLRAAALLPLSRTTSALVSRPAARRRGWRSAAGSGARERR